MKSTSPATQFEFGRVPRAQVGLLRGVRGCGYSPLPTNFRLVDMLLVTLILNQSPPPSP